MFKKKPFPGKEKGGSFCVRGVWQLTRRGVLLKLTGESFKKGTALSGENASFGTKSGEKEEDSIAS